MRKRPAFNIVTKEKRSAHTGNRPAKTSVRRISGVNTRVDSKFSVFTLPPLARQDASTIVTGAGGANFLRSLAVALAAGVPYASVRTISRLPARVLIATPHHSVADNLADRTASLGYTPKHRITVQRITLHDDGELDDPHALSRAAKASSCDFAFLEGVERFTGELLERALSSVRAAFGDSSAPIVTAIPNFGTSNTRNLIVMPVAYFINGEST